MSAGRPNQRPSSRSRPLPPLSSPASSSAVRKGSQPSQVDTRSNPKLTRQTSTDGVKSGLIQRASLHQDASASSMNHFSEQDEQNAHEYVTTNDALSSDKSHRNRKDTTVALSPLEIKLKNGGLAGLSNLGNTCFMNSVLQCLSNTKPLLLFCFDSELSDYLNKSSTSSMKGRLMQEYADLIRKIWSPSNDYSVVTPSSFKSTVGKFAPRFLGYAQQDSQEFLRYLLQGLHEDVNRVHRKPTPIKIDEKEEEKLPERELARLSWERSLRYDNSPISDIFAGQLKSTLECTECQYKSVTFDMFWDLSIPLPRNTSSTTVRDCIQLFMSKEVLDGHEKPMCARCKRKRRCTKKFSIQQCPDILVLHLKRFSQSTTRSKLNTDVDFPLENLRLDELTDVMSESYQGPPPVYNLFGISNHSGTAYSGHYIARCKHPFSNIWHEFNDSSVHTFDDRSRITSSTAYVLFYERNK